MLDFHDYVCLGASGGKECMVIMNKIFKFEQINSNELNINTINILNEHLTKHNATVFEVYENYILVSFDYFNSKSRIAKQKRILLYFDFNNLLIFIEDHKLFNKFDQLFKENFHRSNQELLRLFFIELISEDMENIDEFEKIITIAEDNAIKDSKKDYLNKIIKFRKQLLNLKHYYNQLQVIFDGLLENENKFFDDEALRKLNIIHNRIDRLQLGVLNLRDYVTQMREAYQSQIDIEQNNLMKIFTLITAIFLPLTLMVGWYGMNFKYMPELNSLYGYPIFIAGSIIVSIVLLIYFKKKHWF